jgi:hypothetical protein
MGNSGFRPTRDAARLIYDLIFSMSLEYPWNIPVSEMVSNSMDVFVTMTYFWYATPRKREVVVGGRMGRPGGSGGTPDPCPHCGC